MLPLGNGVHNEHVVITAEGRGVDYRVRRGRVDFVDVLAIDLAFDIKVSSFYECDRVMLKCQNVPELSLMVFNYMF